MLVEAPKIGVATEAAPEKERTRPRGSEAVLTVLPRSFSLSRQHARRPRPSLPFVAVLLGQRLPGQQPLPVVGVLRCRQTSGISSQEGRSHRKNVHNP